ncbi:MAG: HAD-IIA family hydrolase [Rickettsiales bacterium]|jgi:HAD superfamily hydrolase (TIGR01450 family)|nr:HAD-IIA family hydrolase [Rickettsiales bacterium]
MMWKVYSNILELKDEFDCLFLDIWGVLLVGDRLFENTKETMQELINLGKKIIIISNAPELKENVEKMFRKNGILKGENFTDIVTSGDVLNNKLLKDERRLKNVYILGEKQMNVSETVQHNVVDNLEEAEIVFIRSLKVYENETEILNKYSDFLLDCGKRDRNGFKLYSSTSIVPFVEILEKMRKKNLPIVTANPDVVTTKIDIDGNKSFVVAPGAACEYYNKLGGKTTVTGKPNKEIYDYAFNMVPTVDKDRIMMVGDTIETDIKGGINVGIKTCLCLDDGVTSNRIKDEGLDEFFKKETYVPNFLVKRLQF